MCLQFENIIINGETQQGKIINKIHQIILAKVTTSDARQRRAFVTVLNIVRNMSQRHMSTCLLQDHKCYAP